MALIFEFNTYPRTPSDSKAFFHERGSINYYGYVPSEGVDIKKLYEDAVAAESDERRGELFAETFGVISEEQPFLFLAMEDDIAGYEAGMVGPVEEFGSGWNGNTYYRS
jgi:peptide/nickel transport system substrate-binding protein